MPSSTTRFHARTRTRRTCAGAPVCISGVWWRPCGYLAGRFNCSDVGRHVSHVIRDSREIGVDIHRRIRDLCRDGGKKEEGKRKERERKKERRSLIVVVVLHSIYRWRPVSSWNSIDDPYLCFFFFFFCSIRVRSNLSGKSYASSAIFDREPREI